MKDLTEKGLEAEEVKTIKSFASLSIEKAKTVAFNTTEKGIELSNEIATTSVDVLEQIGKSALEFLAVMDNKPNSNSTTGATFEDTINRNYFEVYHGTASVEALEQLSIECNIQVQKLKQEIGKEKLELLNSYLIKITNLFDQENNNNNNNNKAEEISVEKSKVIFKECQDHIEQLVKKYKQDVNETVLLLEKFEEGDLYHLTASYFDKLLLESVKQMNHLVAINMDQIKQNTEISLVQQYSSYDDIVDQASKLHTICQTFLNMLQELSKHYQEILQSILVYVSDIYDTKSQNEEEKNKYLQELQAKLNLHINHLEIDTNTCSSHIVDCYGNLSTIYQSLLYKVEPQQKQ